MPNAGSAGDDNKDRRNLITATKRGQTLDIDVSSVISFDPIQACSNAGCVDIPAFPRINAHLTLTPNGDQFTARLAADKFPSWEVVRYPRNAQRAPNGRNNVVATRDQGVRSDLSGVQSTCVSTPPETNESTHPMAC